jgi:hypothetical protein
LSPNTGISAIIIFKVINPERKCLSIPPSRLTACAEKIIGDHQCGFRRFRSINNHIYKEPT